jgi:hypothetical protein
MAARESCMVVTSGCIFFDFQDISLADPKNEKALGQLLVLVQYQWPEQEDMFASIITTIQKRRKFNFPDFFKYVIGRYPFPTSRTS